MPCTRQSVAEIHGRSPSGILDVRYYGHAYVDASVSASSASITWTAGSVYNRWIWNAMQERGYANIIGQEFQFSTNNGSITVSRRHSAVRTQVAKPHYAATADTMHGRGTVKFR